MSYLLDKQNQKKKFLKIFSYFFVVLILIYFRIPVFNKLSAVTHFFSRPVLVAGNNIGENFSGVISFFISKSSLMAENENYRNQYNEMNTKVVNYNAVLDENLKLKEILGRKNEKVNMVLANILAKPNQSPYDTLIIDIGSNENLVVGDLVFAYGNVPFGHIKEVYGSSSKVVLFTNKGEETEVTISGKDIFMTVIGRGGGNFEMNLIKDLDIVIGTEVVLRGLTPYVVGTVVSILTDPRETFDKVLLSSPVNIQELRFVEIKK